MLEDAFAINPNWDQARIKELSIKLHLPRIKVYKWNWDHKRKYYIQSIKDSD